MSSDQRQQITVHIHVRELGAYGGGTMIAQSELTRDVVEPDRLEGEVSSAIEDAQMHIDRALLARRRTLRKAAQEEAEREAEEERERERRGY